MLSMLSVRFWGILCEIPQINAHNKHPPSEVLQEGGARKSTNTIKANFSSYFLPSSHRVKHGIS